MVGWAGPKNATLKKIVIEKMNEKSLKLKLFDNFAIALLILSLQYIQIVTVSA
jgi:hypothetical protein